MSVRTARAAAKREQIATAARDLFLAHGFAGTSMDAVTVAAGVSKQTLYAYFPTKLDLLGAILTEELGKLDLDQAGPPRLDSLPELRTTLLGFATGFTARVLTPDTVALLRLVLGEVFHLPDLRENFRVAFPARMLSVTAEIIRLADARGIVTAAEPELAARMFIGPLMTFVALDGFRGSSNQVHPPSTADLEFIVDAFLASIEVRR